MLREDAIAGAGNTYDFGARLLSSLYGSWFSIDPLAGKYPSFSPYVAMGNNPIRYIDPDGRDWVESKDGEISWRNDVTADNFQKKGMLAEGEIYRGTSFIRKNIWTQVNINGNSESGLMEENYNSSGKMTYKNLTPCVDKAFEEMEKNIYETGGNPEITKYWKHTQLGLHNSDETPWCAAFVNYTLESVGIEGTNSALAFSFKKFGLNLGNEKPIYGAIAVMNYSHVAIVVGINNDGRVILLGGNQGNAVNLSPNSQKGVMKYVYPNEYTPSSMDLPEYSLRKRSLSRSTSR